MKALAELADRELGRVYRWLRPRAEGGCGGRIPAAAQEQLVATGQFDRADFLPQDGEAFL